MRILNRVGVGALIVSCVFGFAGTNVIRVARAADAPDLGLAEDYSVFGNAGITETPAQNSHLWGDVGDNGAGHASLIASQVDGTLHDVAQPTIVSAISSAYSDLAGESQTGAINLALSPTVGPGVYDVAATAFNSTLTLNGPGVYIFRSTSSIAQTTGGTMILNGGATACNVYWQIPAAMTFAATGNIEGTIIAGAQITFASGASLVGRAWAGTQVTMDNNQITEPDCTPPPATATLHVIKAVINDGVGTADASDAVLHVKDSLGDEVTDSPQAGEGDPGTTYILDAGDYTVSESTLAGYDATFSGDCDTDGTITLAPDDDVTCTVTNNDTPVAPATITVVKTVIGGNKVIADFPLFVNGGLVLHGVANTFAPGAYTVTETTDSNYTQSFALDCAGGEIDLNPGDVKVCAITNTRKSSGGGGSNNSSIVPPLIDVVKVPSPLALPLGPGPVTYTYTLRNIGTVPVTNVTMVGDTCSPITLFSGDINSDAKLDVNETWVYRCTTTLSATHTNTMTATGWANGISAIDIASATVIVGASVVPPLIHVTKIPSPLALSTPGLVTYTERITNPGTIPLTNVRLTDDKCAPMKYISGDVNTDSKLDTNETWVYTCQANLNKTTTNTATAEGIGNGITVRDFAIATVVVSVPGLPATGFPPENNILPIVVFIGISLASIFLYFAQKKQTA